MDVLPFKPLFKCPECNTLSDTIEIRFIESAYSDFVDEKVYCCEACFDEKQKDKIPEWEDYHNRKWEDYH